MKTTTLVLAGAIALSSTAAFAFNGRSMVTLSGFEGGDRQERSLDFRNSTGTDTDATTGENANVSQNNIAVNYTYAITDAIMVGGIYKRWNVETSGDVAEAGDKQTTMGLQVIYNLANRLTDTTYVGLRYETMKSDESEGNDDEFTTKTWGLDVGHRFNLGKLGGMTFTYSPSVSLNLANTDFDADGVDKQSRTTVALNIVKFDLLF